MIVFVGIIIAIAGYIVFTTKSPVPELPSAPVVKPAQVDTKDWKTYRNEEFGFEVKYPSEFAIKQYGASRSELEMDKGKSVSDGGAVFEMHLASEWPSDEDTLLYISATPQYGYHPSLISDKPLYVRNGFYYFPSNAKGYVGKIIADVLSTFKFTK